MPMLVSRAGYLVLALLPFLLSPAVVPAAEPAGPPAPPRTISVNEQTGATLPLESRFLDENGLSVTIGSLIDKPTILLPIYFTCPNSCSTNLANLAIAMDRMKLQAGSDYRAIALSFDDEETPETARSAKANYLNLLGDDFPADQWSFLTGSRAAIDAVLDSVGFSYKKLADGTFIHPSMLVVLADSGMIIKYVYGTFIPGDIEIALAEAQRGRPATSIKRFLDYCFNYDPTATNAVFETVKLLIIGTFALGLAFFFIRILRKKGGR
jgi:protein SCO1/2